MKKLLKICAVFLSVICLCSCGKGQDMKTAGEIGEITELEFEILQNVEDYDFGTYQKTEGFGVTKYYGSDYMLEKSDDGNFYKEEGEFVSYEVTAWPDYADGGRYVTRINCTDQDVRVFGLTLKNSLAEFKAVFEELGYNVMESDPYGACGAIKAQKGGIMVSVCDYGEASGKTLTIRAEVTNREGIQY